MVQMNPRIRGLMIMRGREALPSVQSTFYSGRIRERFLALDVFRKTTEQQSH